MQEYDDKWHQDSCLDDDMVLILQSTSLAANVVEMKRHENDRRLQRNRSR